MILNNYFFSIFISTLVFLVAPSFVSAASLSLSPNTGVYTAGGTFTVQVKVNTDGKPVNASEGSLKFNPQELSVVSINNASSIFNLWVTEPTFSNSAGTITFSGGKPTGYTGSSGTVFNITFRTANANTARVSFTNGSVLANDGKGTNVLSGMSGGTYTVQAVTSQPKPEVIEYVAPANTPGVPKITSNTHSDPGAWYNQNTAVLSWNLPVAITGVRTLLNDNPTSIPTKVYNNPISTITLEDLRDGVSYFHLQFRNADGWGKVNHFRLSVDTVKPESFEISLPENVNLSNPSQILELKAEDITSGVEKYSIKIDDNEPYVYEDVEQIGQVVLPELDPGYHSVIIEAFDKAGNSLISTFSFTVEAFERPRFTEYPAELSEDVIPVIRGLTRPNSDVEVFVHKIGSEPQQYSLKADDKGVFTLIPEGTFSTGVYELTARAVDEFGAQSEISESVRIAVQQPGFIRVGTMLVNVLSVVVPLVAMMVVLVLAFWFLVFYVRKLRRKISIESKEALDILATEFTSLHEKLKTEEAKLTDSKRSKKLNKSEEELFITLSKALVSAQAQVEKEVEDVEKLVKKKK